MMISSPSIILHTPQLGENIGSAARIMLNFGLTDLRLVAPRDGWPNAAADPLSAGAFEAGVEVRVFDTIEAAIAEQKPLVYFPAGEKYRIDRDVIISGAVRTFFGGSPKTRISNGIGEKEDTSSGPSLVLGSDLPLFEFDLLDTAHLRHDHPTELIIRHCRTDHISAGEKCGPLFIEDSEGMFRFSKHQRVWGRQLNPETKGVPEIINDGGQLWILGLKTEYLSTKIENRNGARTEILGGLMYPVHPVTDESLPMFLNIDSDMSLVHGVSVYGKNHKIYIKETRGTETREYREWHWENGRPITNLYRAAK